MSVRLRHLVDLAPRLRRRLPEDLPVSFSPMDALKNGLGGLGELPVRPFGDLAKGSYNFFEDGDILLAKVTPCFENGKKALAKHLKNGMGFATSEVHVVRPKRGKIDSRFLLYLFSSEGFRAEGMATMTGSGGLRRVSESAILNHRPAVTDLEAQKAIAKFLDRETARIEQLMEKKQRLLKVLNAKLQTEIARAVSQGIQSDVSLVDSGIDWIGKIPAHWSITKLGYLGRCANGINIGGDAFGSGYPFISYGDVYKNRVMPNKISGLVQSTKSDRRSYSVEAGDVFFTRTSETIDEVAFSSVSMETIKDAVFAGFLIRFRPSKGKLYPLFSKFAFQQSALRYYFAREMNVITRASLSQDLLRNLPMALPPLDEQKKIARHLEELEMSIRAISEKTELTIETLRERRIALITAAVTGQIDVATYGRPGNTDRTFDRIEVEMGT